MKNTEGAIWMAIEKGDMTALTSLLSPNCKYPEPCGYRDEGYCLYKGQEQFCPLVKESERSNK